MISDMAEIDGRHVCGPFPDQNEPMGSSYTCPDCGMGYSYERLTGWHTDGLFAGDPSDEFKARNS